MPSRNSIMYIVCSSFPHLMTLLDEILRNSESHMCKHIRSEKWGQIAWSHWACPGAEEGHRKAQAFTSGPTLVRNTVSAKRPEPQLDVSPPLNYARGLALPWHGPCIVQPVGKHKQSEPSVPTRVRRRARPGYNARRSASLHGAPSMRSLAHQGTAK